MTDDLQTFRDALARDDLERSESLSLAITMVLFAVAIVAMVLTFALAPY
jgi:hypothetical protein